MHIYQASHSTPENICQDSVSQTERNMRGNAHYKLLRRKLSEATKSTHPTKSSIAHTVEYYYNC